MPEGMAKVELAPFAGFFLVLVLVVIAIATMAVYSFTELMVAYAYDTVNRGNPVGLFGMVYALEKTSSTIATFAAGQIRATLGLGAEAMSYMVSHGSLDVEHMQHFEKLMNRLDDVQDRQAVLHAAGVFYELYSNIFRALPISADLEEGRSHAA